MGKTRVPVAKVRKIKVDPLPPEQRDSLLRLIASQDLQNLQYKLRQSKSKSEQTKLNKKIAKIYQENPGFKEAEERKSRTICGYPNPRKRPI